MRSDRNIENDQIKKPEGHTCKKMQKEDLLLYAVTDRHWLNGETLYSQVEKTLEGGTTFVQLREKELDEAHFLEEAKKIKELCDRYHVPFVINDNVDIALEIDADGVHVGQSDMEAGDVRAKLGPDKIIGVSAQTVGQALLAQERGADYLGVGAVFHTDSKADAADISHETLKAITEAVDIPVIAIGGISKENVSELSGTGICGKRYKKRNEETEKINRGNGGSMIKGAIFDVDGTLLDSMGIWKDVGVRYLNSIGIEAEPDLGNILFTMSIQEGAQYVKEHYHLSQETDEIEQNVLDIISDYYKETAPLKSGAVELLEKLRNSNIPMTIASSNNKKEIEMAFERLEIVKYFDRIFTCEEAGAGKTKPDIYLQAAEYLGSRPEETLVFEDVIHAVRTAKKAGFQVVGIYDEASKDDQEEIQREADCYCRDWRELMKKKTALTIAGSDSSGGAGIQADIKTMQANGVYAMSAITALTAQNTTGVTGIMEVSPEFLENQLDAVITDIRPDAVKIGMVSSEKLIKTISKKLKEYHAENIVVDPVMVATSGSRLISENAIETLKTQLLPMASVITPNIPEAEVLAEMEIRSEKDMVEAAKKINEMYHCAVLCKGGHSLNDANDLLYQNGKATWFRGKRINNPNTHGTGCTLSSAIASNLAKGYSLEESIHRAKEYISGALAAMLDLGKGSGPMDHGFEIRGRFGI